MNQGTNAKASSQPWIRRIRPISAVRPRPAEALTTCSPTGNTACLSAREEEVQHCYLHDAVVGTKVGWRRLMLPFWAIEVSYVGTGVCD